MWKGRIQIPPLTCSLAKGFGPPYLPSRQLSTLSPPEARRSLGLPRILLPSASTHPSSSGWDWWIRAGGTRRSSGQGPRPQGNRKSRVLWEEPLGSGRLGVGSARVLGQSGWLLTAADGLGPAPDPVALALPLFRPCQHQVRGAAVADLVPKAKSGPCPHRAHRNARVRAVSSCE